MRKGIVLILWSLLLGMGTLVAADDEGARLTFDHLNHNFGTLQQGDEKVTHIFEFTNDGTAPLVIVRTTTSCRCINIKYPKRPVRTGEKGTIEVSYDPKDAGVFNKGIDIHANINGGYITLFVTGEVLPTPHP